MIVLGIETATMAGSVAVVKENSLMAELVIDSVKSHSERLLKSIDQVLEASQILVEKCDAVAVSIGPGSFTGLRIGVSTAKAIAFAIQKPIIGISTLEVLSCNLPFACGLICPMLDARKKEVFTALYEWIDKRLKIIASERVLPPAKMINTLDRSQETIFLGNGAQLYREFIRSEFGEKAVFPPIYHNFPRASVVASLGMKRLVQKHTDSVETLVPKYLRLSDAEINWAQKQTDVHIHC
jgi:tRNA threonylcarbamoyladenosine biosynthesis protein TsaB